MMNFLSGILRDEGGFEYKKAIVDTIINVIEDSPDGKEAGMIKCFLYCVTDFCIVSQCISKLVLKLLIIYSERMSDEV